MHYRPATPARQATDHPTTPAPATGPVELFARLVEALNRCDRRGTLLAQRALRRAGYSVVPLGRRRPGGER
jgi:hypothetical protein